MKGFEQLHPAIQYHIVNSLGWRELRPFQDAVIPNVLAGDHLIVLAPTAGGKTEAAFFPTLSRMLAEDWFGLSVLYVCPIKALLNNLDHRLTHYCGLVGRRSGVWHGDVNASARKKLLRDPPDCLLTTPESLEVMLISRTIDDERLFANLKVIIVDEVHAFAGDDRGWHLLSVLERVSRLAGREIQRIGLSATVGNPEQLLDWLSGNCQAPKHVMHPPKSAPTPAEVQIDFVGSLENAATVIARLHRGEKRLVFLDSRAGTEDLGLMLRGLGVNTFVTHSSLSQDERLQTEAAFAEGQDCVIVATSVLELGIDVGDLDRVIQIDAPLTVASFLQRMGRTGRRSDSIRNCLMLATKSEKLLQAAALVELWENGFIEPIVPPPDPYHIVSQQLMALALQQGGIGRKDWFEWISGVRGFSALSREKLERLVDWMTESSILSNDAGVMWLGEKGEQRYGRRNFLELFTVFMTPPLFLVMHGRREIGQVDEAALIFKQDGNRVLSLGGNAWKVNFIDWQRKFAYVEPTDEVARTRWAGSGIGLSFDLCQTMQSILCDSEVSSRWSKRGQSEIERLRGEFSWLESEKTSLNFDPDSGCTWWTFCGAKANSTVAYYLAQIFDRNVSSDGFSLKFPGSVETEPLIQAIGELQNRSVEDLKPMPHEHAIRGLKFSSCLYPELAQHVMSIRLRDNRAVTHLLETGISMKKISDGSAKPSIGNRRSNYARPAGPVPKSKRAKRIPESTINLADRSTADTALQALSIRQPWAELILRGEKTIEYRSLPTKVRGKIYIYASATRYEQSEEKKFQENLEFSIDVLPRGVIVGTVEIFDCNESDEEEGHFEWLLQNPIRLELPLKPECRPNPVWFYPFRD